MDDGMELVLIAAAAVAAYFIYEHWATTQGGTSAGGYTTPGMTPTQSVTQPATNITTSPATTTRLAPAGTTSPFPWGSSLTPPPTGMTPYYYQQVALLQKCPQPSIPANIQLGDPCNYLTLGGAATCATAQGVWQGPQWGCGPLPQPMAA